MLAGPLKIKILCPMLAPGAEIPPPPHKGRPHLLQIVIQRLVCFMALSTSILLNANNLPVGRTGKENG